MTQLENAGTRLAHDGPRVRAARRAEQNAFQFYGVDFSEHHVEIPDLELQIRVTEAGSGPPVVMIPGGIGHGVIWIPLLPELVSDYTVYIMDRPGGGMSDGIDHRSVPLRTIAARSTAALFDHFGLEDAPLIGNSMGGLWSFRFALEYPNRVSSIAQLGCPALYPGTSAPFPMRLMSLPGIGEPLIEMAMQPDDVEAARNGLGVLGHPEETIANLPMELIEAWYRMNKLPHFKRSWESLLQSALRLRGAAPEAAFTVDDLRTIRSPVILIWGTDDPFGSVDAGRSGATYFPDAEFHEAGVGHLPWLDEPEVCGRLLLDFLTS